MLRVGLDGEMESVKRQLLGALLFLICIQMCLTVCYVYMVRNYPYKSMHVNRKWEEILSYNGKPMNRSQIQCYKFLLEKKRYSLSSWVHVKEKELDALTNASKDSFPDKTLKALDYQLQQIEQYGKPLSTQNYHNVTYTTRKERDQVHSKPDLYVFALSYMDQMSWASTRWRSLQCWSNQLSQRYSIHVIEPFVTDGAHLGVPTHPNQNLNEVLKFSDIFDVSLWQRSVPNLSDHVNIVTWDAFLRSGATNVVTVQIIYPYHYYCTENGQTDKICNNTRMQRLFAQHLPQKFFTLMKSICINFRELDILTMEQFNDMIFDSIPEDLPITVMFDEWRGLSENTCFVRVSSEICQPVSAGSFVGVTLNLMRPSLKVDNAARRYIHRYIHVPNQHGYAAIIIRWEKILIYDFYHNKSHHYSGSRCVKRILKYVRAELYKKRHIQAFFLSTDIGKYGSSSFNLYKSTRKSTSILKKYTEKLSRILNHESLSLSEYEQRFEEISGTTSPAFISQLQKGIAARARCLLLVGWGNFLTNALDIYKGMHKGQLCHKQIKLC